ncbi:MAG: hypothetical protein JWO82_3708 [Akkermansiaceae bacterium]|nr:hypothetical protein [Akkermansiaceae bacterium]
MRFQKLVQNLVIPTGIALWLVALGFGFHRLAAYSLRPGETPAVIVTDWPAGLPIERSSGPPTLIVTLHPECPCSKATLTELQRIAASTPSLRLYAVFETYDALPEEIHGSALWRQATAIQGLNAMIDAEGKIAAQLGNKTSGEVRLFSSQGTLLFSGGITASRGHSGENPASDAVIALASGSSTTPQLHVPTFGCVLDR